MSTITRIKCKTDNCYLISEGRNAILVDTGSLSNVMDLPGAWSLACLLRFCAKRKLNDLQTSFM